MRSVRHQYLRDTILGATGPFSAIANRTHVEAELLIDKVGKDLTKNTATMLEAVRADFDRKNARKDDHAEQGRDFRKQLHELVEEARRILNSVT